MADYAITFARSARKELEVLEEKQVNRIFPRVEAPGKGATPEEHQHWGGGVSEEGSNLRAANVNTP